MIRRIYSLFVIFASIYLLPASSTAQTPDAPATIKFINDKLGPACKFDLVRGEIIAIYNQDGSLIREDKVAISELNPEKSGYEANEKVFFIPCKEENYKCVYRKMYKTGNFREYSRISFVIENDEKLVASLKKAFIHLYKINEDRKYKETVKFE